MGIPFVLIDDDEALIRLAADHFADAGFEVLEAADGAQVLALLARLPVIMVMVTDVQMPGDPDGFALLHIVCEACPDCAIDVVSGRALPMAGDLAECARYLPKPYRGEEIVPVVERLLAA